MLRSLLLNYSLAVILSFCLACAGDRAGVSHDVVGGLGLEPTPSGESRGNSELCEPLAEADFWESDKGQDAMFALFQYMFTDANLSGSAYGAADFIFVGLLIDESRIDLPRDLMARFDDIRVLPQSMSEANSHTLEVGHKLKDGVGVLYVAEPKGVGSPDVLYVHGYFFSRPLGASCVRYRVEPAGDGWQITVVEVVWES